MSKKLTLAFILDNKVPSVGPIEKKKTLKTSRRNVRRRKTHKTFLHRRHSPLLAYGARTHLVDPMRGHVEHIPLPLTGPCDAVTHAHRVVHRCRRSVSDNHILVTETVTSLPQ